MKKLVLAKRAQCFVWAALAVCALSAVPRKAHAQSVQDCAANQFLDRSAPNADRELLWDFSISTDPERCMQVRVGQTVFWNGVRDVHPLGGSGGDNPNPISLHQNGSVTFTSTGTFGYICLAHSSMRGAIKVLPALAAPAQAVPGASPWLAGGLMLALLASGLFALARRQGGGARLARRP